MNVESSVSDLPNLRLRVFTPTRPGKWPAVLAYSDIFQHTGPHLRVCTRLAARGFTVVAPELYGRVAPAGTVLRFEEDRQRALDCAAQMTLEWFDADLAAALAFTREHASVDPSRVYAAGWCIGGHLAFRAALDSQVKATTCFYATGLHSNSLGGAVGTATSLTQAHRIAGELLMVWGTRDPHIPKEGRQVIHAALANAGTSFQVRTFAAEHTFMRDEGARWEPAAADEAFEAMVSLFTR
jgi:carboxymethylenebutenolidase